MRRYAVANELIIPVTFTIRDECDVKALKRRIGNLIRALRKRVFNGNSFPYVFVIEGGHLEETIDSQLETFSCVRPHIHCLFSAEINKANLPEWKYGNAPWVGDPLTLDELRRMTTYMSKTFADEDRFDTRRYNSAKGFAPHQRTHYFSTRSDALAFLAAEYSGNEIRGCSLSESTAEADSASVSYQWDDALADEMTEATQSNES